MRGLRPLLTALAERATGMHILPTLPRGVDLRSDIAASLPRLAIRTVFDVGANVGQLARRYRAWFPAAHLVCFEPVRSTFERLQQALGADPLAQCHRLALGAKAGQGRMLVEQNSELSTLAADGTPARAATEEVPIATLDGCCAEHAVARIGLLKIDTEGSDHDVLAGSSAMLAAQRIDLVQVEAGMNPDNRYHVPFETLNATLLARGYRLFALYEQMHEWPTREPQLRRANLVYLSSRMIETNRS